MCPGSVKSVEETNALSCCREGKPMETLRICKCVLWKCQISRGKNALSGCRKENRWTPEGFANVCLQSVKPIGEIDTLVGRRVEKPMETRRICKCVPSKCQVSRGNRYAYWSPCRKTYGNPEDLPMCAFEVSNQSAKQIHVMVDLRKTYENLKDLSICTFEIG